MKKIIKNLISTNYTKSNNKKNLYIVIHYTAGTTSKKGSAENTRNYFNNSSAKASAHYIVDDFDIVQAVEDSDVAWHCGSSSGYIHATCRNANSIGIEICSCHDNFQGYERTSASDPGWYITKEAKENAAELVAYLMKKHNINIYNVIRHFDVTGKDCPAPWVDENKEGLKGWLSFIALVEEKLKGENEMKFEKIEECPEWSQEAIKFYIDKGYLKGTEKGLELSSEMLRILVVLYRVLKGELK